MPSGLPGRSGPAHFAGAGRLPVVARRDPADAAARVAGDSAADLAAGHRSRHAARTYTLNGETAIGGEDVAGVLRAVVERAVAAAAARVARPSARWPPVPPLW